MVEIKKDEKNMYCFSVKSTGGSIILGSIPFPNKEAIHKVILDLNSMDRHENIFERKTNHQGKFLFNLKDRTGNIIGSSQLYSSEAGMENGIKNTKNSLKSVPSVE